jgi:chlorite dismutase
MSDDTIYVQAVALGLDAAWRRLPAEAQEADVAAVLEAEAETTRLGIRTLTYSTVGLEPGVDMLLFRLAPSVEALESAGSRLARSGLGRWLTVRHSLLGLIGPSQYVRKPTSQERSVLDGEPAAYLVVYPFTKSTDWYLQSREERQSIMNEHMRVGHKYPTVRQLLAYSFGLDDQDFVVAYDTDDLAAFGSLVRDLRGTESRRSTVRDTPLLLGVHRPLPELLGRLVDRTAVVA